MIKLWRYLRNYKLSVVLIIVFTFIQTMTELLLPTYMADIINNGVMNSDTSYILRVGGMMLGVALFGGFITVIARYLSSKVGVGFGKDLRRMVFKRSSDFSLHEVDRFGTSSLITRATNDISQVERVTMMILRFFMRAPLMAVGSIIMALRLDVPLTFVIITVVFFMGITIVILARMTMPLFKQVQKKVDKLNLVVRERLNGMRVIRAFNKTNHELNRFEDANKDLTDLSIKVNKLMAIMQPMMMVFFNVTTIALVWFGAQRVDMGAMAVGDLMAFIQYGNQIMFSVLMLTMVFIMIPRAQASAVRINEVLEVEAEIKEPTAPQLVSDKVDLEFDDVTFYYHSDKEAREAAIKNLSFKMKPGQVTAVIGGTGSGKTTLVNLIPRFYDVHEGSIKLGGTDIRELKTNDLRSKIGLVPQKALLFTGSVKDNMRFGKEEATDQDIEKALKIAQGYDFVMEKEGRMDGVIAQGGKNLSGGQKQRLSIARALVKEPALYIFDDAFSALDFKTEAKLRRELYKETGDAMVLVVAQRVTTVMDADQIIVLDNGEAVGIGDHHTLLKNNEVYREIVLSQLSEEEIA